MTPSHKWQFWIDRGGTFTDVVARAPSGALVTEKLLSVAPGHYQDAALEAMARILAREEGLPALDADRIEAVRMGTTVATNALLERKGEDLLLVTTEGLSDVLRIGTQNRPDLFALDIRLPSMLYRAVLEVPGRVRADGTEVTPLDLDAARCGLQAAYDDGIRAVAIVFMHAWRFPDHERSIGALARDIGFTQISLSHEVSPLMRLVGRGDTTVADAYLSPVLRRYIDGVAAALSGARLLFMQSNGGLAEAGRFRGRDAVLSGPAGGIVGAVATAGRAGMERIITFDMGGTSTDVAHYDGTYERDHETTLAGVRLRAPMLRIHTVAAGGGSLLRFRDGRFQVGPESAGADPGPACYGRGGPLAVTDANLVLGRIRPEFFPSLFGANADRPLDRAASVGGFEALAQTIKAETGKAMTIAEIAEGFLRIATDNMAAAIKKVSTERGFDVTRYGLVAFGGAGGQHACRVADALGIREILIHPLGGMLSALGMGLAELRDLREAAIEAPFVPEVMDALTARMDEAEAKARAALHEQGVDPARVTVTRSLHLRYAGTDTGLDVPFGSFDDMGARFDDRHRRRFGFVMEDTPLIAAAVSAEAAGGGGDGIDLGAVASRGPEDAPDHVAACFEGVVRDVPACARGGLSSGDKVEGPAIITENGATTVIEPGWRAVMDDDGALIMRREEKALRVAASGTGRDPVLLEVFNNLFMSVAEDMGAVLANTAHSVNIKERLDFSCAVFDGEGRLVANAPHMPVHLGSMGAAVRAVIRGRGLGDHDGRDGGDCFVHNDPYDGGTHLPDVTVVRAVRDGDGAILFFVAARGHHADIGGSHPGSMPPVSTTIAEEGILFTGEALVENGVFQEKSIRERLGAGADPARNPDQNIADLKAEAAACARGAEALMRMLDMFGRDVVIAYMGHVQDNACEAVRRMIAGLDDGAFEVPMDDGSVIRVALRIDRAAGRAVVDFTGTSVASPTNFNAPEAVCRAAVLYTFRALVDEPIPMNDGCMRPIELIIPEGCLLSPKPPAAVVAGNVETSQCIVDALMAATGRLAAGPGTMNNFTFGNDDYQYYETICSGAGAGPGFDGASAVQTHMTNSRLTDAEVLEWRFPVMVDRFALRVGSGGGGQFRGGDGVVRCIRFLAPMKAAILSNRRLTAPFGIRGGNAGECGSARVIRVNGQVEDLGPMAEVSMAAGDVFVVETPGGGGYGKQK